MHKILQILPALLLVFVSGSAAAQQNASGFNQQEQDSTGKQVHDQVKGGLDNIGGAENQQSPSQSSNQYDTSQIHDQAHEAVQKGADVFDSVTGAFR